MSSFGGMNWLAKNRVRRNGSGDEWRTSPQLAGVVIATELVFGTQSHHINFSESPEENTRMILFLDTKRQTPDICSADEDVVVLSGITKARGQIDRRADVILALEHEDFTGGDTDSHREGSTDVFAAFLHVQCETNSHLLVYGHDHATIPKPLIDSDTPRGGHIAHLGPELRENVARGCITVFCGVLGEPGQIHENEGSFNFHEWAQATSRHDGLVAH